MLGNISSERVNVMRHKKLRKHVWYRVLAVAQSGILCAAALAQSESYPKGKKPDHGTIRPEILVLPQQTVKEQWPVILELVNVPGLLQQVEPGQCIRLGVV